MDDGGPRVLYIDDDPGLARLVRRSLEARGYVVEHAADPETGLARLRQGGIAVVALDHHMPGRNGLDVLPAIRALPDAPPVIYVTGSEDTQVAVAALKSGAADYVWKDVEGHFRDLLGEAIGTALEQERLRREAERAQAEIRRLNSLLALQVDERTRERDRLWRLSRDMLAVIDNHGRFRSLSPSAAIILGRPPEELAGLPFRDLMHPDDQAAGRTAYQRLVAGEPVDAFENRYRHADGSWRRLSWSAVAEGGLIFATARDVTDQRALEEQLRQAQRIEALGQLTGGIAHDFNNLLQGMSGSLELIRRKAGDTDRVQALADAGLEAASRGTRLTAQLLAFSRAQRIEERPVVLSDLIIGMRNLLDRSLGPLVTVALDLGTDRGAVMSDPTQLEMAVLNLAINARDAMPDGGHIVVATRPLRLSADAELPAGDYLEMSVADNGVGMPSEVAARAFEPFFTTKGLGRGTGLGLSQVYGIARQSGGTARIESREDGGTTVRLMLPRTENVVVPEDAGGPAGAEALERPASVLLVDDDQDVRRLVTEALETLGAQVRSAGDGEKALRALAAERPDLLLVDYAMPGMTGAELAQAARDRWPDLPVVFATGYSDSQAIEEVLGEDARILRKPFRLADLRAVLVKALSDRAASGRDLGPEDASRRQAAQPLG